MSATKQHIIDIKYNTKYCNPCIWNGPVIVKYNTMELYEKDGLNKQTINTMKKETAQLLAVFLVACYLIGQLQDIYSK